MFNFNQNRLRHVRTVHQGMKRADNEKRKKDQESTDKAEKQGLLACGSWAACEESVESIPQAVFKSPVDYVAVAMKGSFTKNKSLLRHVRTGHQGMKRTDNDTRKRDVTDNEARKEGLLKRSQVGPFGEHGNHNRTLT